MKIFVNALSARRGGSLAFSRNLLPRMASLDGQVEWHLYVSKGSKGDFQTPETGNLIVKEIPFDTSSPMHRVFYENYLLPSELIRGNYHAYFQVDDNVPLVVHASRILSMAVFHATIPFLLPDEMGDPWLKLLYWRFIKGLALRQVDIPVTVSYCAKGELAQGSGKIFRRLQVIYHGVDHEMFSSSPDRSDKNINLALPEEFILSVSTRNPHKNYLRLVKAYASLVINNSIKEDLVLIGDPVWKSTENDLVTYVEDKGLSNRVHILEPVDHFLLPPIYRRAKAYIYPSLYDSFGITPLEAMACGTPVAVSAFSALPEICGDAAEYFDPLDVDSIASALLTVVGNKARREELSWQGSSHSKKFTWDKAAKSYYELLLSPSIKEWNA